MKRLFLALLAIVFIATTTALAYPITIETSCGTHNTDTELWGGLSEDEIKTELEKICSGVLMPPTGPYSL